MLTVTYFYHKSVFEKSCKPLETRQKLPFLSCTFGIPVLSPIKFWITKPNFALLPLLPLVFIISAHLTDNGCPLRVFVDKNLLDCWCAERQTFHQIGRNGATFTPLCVCYDCFIETVVNCLFSGLGGRTLPEKENVAKKLGAEVGMLEHKNIVLLSA